MFKCKECGRQFGANTPEVCPGCGKANKAIEKETRGLHILYFLSDIGCILELGIIALIIWGLVLIVRVIF